MSRPRRATSVIPTATKEAAARLPDLVADQIGPMHRVVSTGHEQPWWFSTRDGRALEAGRFDLAGGRGTCYFAEEEIAALRERLLDPEAPDIRPPSSVLDDLRVWTVEPPPPVSAVDTTDADRGLPLEFGGGSDYEACWQWADRLDADGRGAVVYWARASPGRVRAIAVFGDASQPQDPSPGHPPGSSRPAAQWRATLEQLGIVGPPPSSAELTRARDP